MCTTKKAQDKMFKYFTSHLFLIVIILFAQNGFGQEEFEKHLINNEVTINYPDSTVFAQLYAGEKIIKPKQNRVYLWYRANDIKQTRGGIDGKALDGKYIVYYHDKNLKESGQTKKGLRKGKWLRWHYNGELYEVIKWKKGRQHGKFLIYDDHGKLISKGKFRKGKLHGKVYHYDKNGKWSIKIYNKGEFIEDVIIPDKEVKTSVANPKESKSVNANTLDTTVKKSWKDKIKSPFIWLKYKFTKKNKTATTPSVTQ